MKFCSNFSVHFRPVLCFELQNTVYWVWKCVIVAIFSPCISTYSKFKHSTSSPLTPRLSALFYTFVEMLDADWITKISLQYILLLSNFVGKCVD